MARLSDKQRKAMFAKGDFAIVKSGFDKDKVGRVIGTNKSTVPNSDLVFVTIQTLNNKRIHGSTDAFDKIKPSSRMRNFFKFQDELDKQRKLALRDEKNRLLR